MLNKNQMIVLVVALTLAAMLVWAFVNAWELCPVVAVVMVIVYPGISVITGIKKYLKSRGL